ncbi:MAG: TRAP transporter small permease subunit [Kordiimonadaceae bacterium]|nr:TRAP transporter small permease subunit [Kordiimonadaceae bacterium]
MEALLTFSKRLEGVSSFIGKKAVWLLLVLMIVIVTDITLRRWFVIGSAKLQELEWHLHGALFLLCLGWAYTKNAHVRIELFSERFSNRGAATIEFIGCLLFLLPYVAAILYFGTVYTAYSVSYNEASASATGLPFRWIIKSVIVLGFGVLGLAGLSRLIESALFLFGPKTIAEQTSFAKRKPVTSAPKQADTAGGAS